MKNEVKVTRNRLRFAAAALVGLLAGSELVRGRPHQAPQAPQAERIAVGFLRTVNDAEFRYKESAGTFAAWGELARSDMVQNSLTRIAAMPGGAGSSVEQPVPGYSIALYISPDGSHYLCSLRNLARIKCPASFYTDDGGVILRAKPIGCQ